MTQLHPDTGKYLCLTDYVHSMAVMSICQIFCIFVIILVLALRKSAHTAYTRAAVRTSMQKQCAYDRMPPQCEPAATRNETNCFTPEDGGTTATIEKRRYRQYTAVLFFSTMNESRRRAFFQCKRARNAENTTFAAEQRGMKPAARIKIEPMSADPRGHIGLKERRAVLRGCR